MSDSFPSSKKGARKLRQEQEKLKKLEEELATERAKQEKAEDPMTSDEEDADNDKDVTVLESLEDSEKERQMIFKPFTKMTSNSLIASNQLDFSQISSELESWNLGVIQQKPEEFASMVAHFVLTGSHIHTIGSEDITVYANLKKPLYDPNKFETISIGELRVATTIPGLLAAGAKMLDAIMYKGLKEDSRPLPNEHPKTKDGQEPTTYPLFDDPTKIAKYMYIFFFFMLIRAHPPLSSGPYDNQPVPKFITNVMNMTVHAEEVAEYLADFSLAKLDPGWIRHVNMGKLSQEAASRMGLGVAGYRLVSIFNIIKPDRFSGKDKVEKPSYIDDAVFVMRSFKNAGYCWDFHPATRDPNVLAKYGNINKNATNLITECYTKGAIESLLTLKKLAIKPIFDPAHTDYRTWTKDMAYKATNLIFKPKKSLSIK